MALWSKVDLFLADFMHDGMETCDLEIPYLGLGIGSRVRVRVRVRFQGYLTLTLTLDLIP